jgi:uncharacterized protein (TIGR00251 family)
MVDDLFDIAAAEGDAPSGAPPDLILRLHVHPGAGRTAVVGRHGDAIKVKVGAPPADGRANAAVLSLVAETLGIPIAQVELVGGAASRSKRVRVKGVEADDLRRVLQRVVADGNAGGGTGVRPSTR